MASTYSTNLAIELIGTGDQAGAWGNTTNTNLGTLIEQAISGYVTQAVATGTDTSITIPNGATGVARNMYIELTGTGGMNTNLIVPANKKLYFIYNNTSSGQVTVKVAGQTGVSVPNGEKMVLVSDGTDIVNALTYIADFGTNSLTVNNILATSASITTLTGGSSNITTLSGTTLGFTSGTLTNLNVTSLTVSSLSLSNATLASASITTLTATSGTVTTLKSTSATIDNLSSGSAVITTLTGTSANVTNISATSLTVTNTIAGSINGNAATVTNGVYTTGSYANPSWITSLAASKLSGAVAVGNGGTGVTGTPSNGQLLIGNGTGFNLNTLNGGPGVGITNQSGAITITATGTGFIASVSATSPLQSTGTQSIVISIASSTGSGAVVLADSPTMSSATVTNLASTSANITTLTGTTFGTTATTQLRGASAAITNISATSLTVTNTIAGSISGNAATATNGVVTTGSYANPSWITSLATSKLSGTVAVANGGTALSSTPSNGQLLIGNGTGYTLATLTGGTGISVTNSAGSITITASGTGDVAGPASSTDNAVVRFDGTTGKIIQNSTGVTITDGGVLTTTVDASINGVTVGKGTGTGASNVAIGSTAGDSMTNGYYNVMVGATAGTGVTSGYENTLIGYGAGDTITSGVANSMLGKWAGIDISSGSYNTGIGQLALGNAIINCTNSSALGYNAQITGNDQVQLGNSSTNTYYYNTIQARSDMRDKAEIQDTDLGLNFIMALRPRKYKWDLREMYRAPRPAPNASQQEIDAWKQANSMSALTHDGTYKRTRFHQGLIAQEVKQVMDQMGVDFGGYQDHKIKGGEDVLSIGYDEMIAPLIKAIQELKAEFDEYKRTHP